MNRKSILAISAALLLSGGLFYFYGGHSTPAGQAPLVSLTPRTLSTMVGAFNEASTDVRVLVLLAPT